MKNQHDFYIEYLKKQLALPSKADFYISKTVPINPIKLNKLWNNLCIIMFLFEL